MNFVSGVMSNKYCALYVRAVKLSVGRSGFVEMVYKGSPTDPIWSGTDNDHYPNADGLSHFTVLSIGLTTVYYLCVRHLLVMRIFVH